MRKTTIISTITLAFLINQNDIKAGKIHGLDEIRNDQFPPKIFVVKPAQPQPSTDENKENEEKFPGQGQQLGGDPYVNVLLGIEHKEGRRLAKARKKHLRKSMPDKLNITPTLFSVGKRASLQN